MPMMGTAEINGKIRRVVYCSRDMKCEFYGITSSEVRRHELEVHPMPHDNEPKDNDLSKINPQLRRKQ